MHKFLHFFERNIIIVLILMMMLCILLATVELAVILWHELRAQPVGLLNMKSMFQVFGFFFMILIGLELLETIKAYLIEDVIHVEVVFLVAMIAIARKVIILDYKDMTPGMLYGIAAVILALSAGYFLVKRVHGGAAPEPLNALLSEEHGQRREHE